MTRALDTLTEKERETLRLMVRGHDAKSMALALDLSVHTVNDRLRAARQKLGVTSSREAARLVFEQEAATPEIHVHDEIGSADRAGEPDQSVPPKGRRGGGPSAGRRMAWLAGGLIMSALLALLLVSSPMADPAAAGKAETAAPDVESRDQAVEAAARRWLALVDAAKWEASFDATGRTFKQSNTLDGWTSAATRVRGPQGAFVSRELLTVRYLNAPPRGYQEVAFATRYENASVVETITLQNEAGDWKVVGIMID